MQRRIYLLIVGILLISVVPLMVVAAPEVQDNVTCATEYVVQEGEWLSTIAETQLGDTTAYTAIIEETNKMHAVDDTFAELDDSGTIEIGWKLCISTVAEATEEATDETETDEAETSEVVEDTEETASSEGSVSSGEALFVEKTCFACHSLDGVDGVGPSLVDMLGNEVELDSGETLIRDEAYLRRSILDPQIELVKDYSPSMLLFDGLSESEVDDLIAYLRSFSSKAESEDPSSSDTDETASDEAETTEVVEEATEETADTWAPDAFAASAFPPSFPVDTRHEDPWYDEDSKCQTCHEKQIDDAPEIPHDVWTMNCRSCHLPSTQALEPAVADWAPSSFSSGAFPPAYTPDAKHKDAWFNDECESCHEQELEGAPEIPHDVWTSNCRSCHVPDVQENE